MKCVVDVNENSCLIYVFTGRIGNPQLTFAKIAQSERHEIVTEELSKS